MPNLIPQQRTCLFITDTGEHDLAVFAYIYAESSLTYLEILVDINDYLHKYHNKVYYYPDFTLDDATALIKRYATDYPQYIISIRKGLIK